MNELTLTLIRLAFLAVLWLFVIAAVGVVRTDLFGQSSSRRRSGRASRQPKPAARQASRAGSGDTAAAAGHAGATRRHHHRPRPTSRSPSAGRMTPRWCSTMTTLRADMPGSSRRTASGSSRTSARPTAPTSTAEGDPADPRAGRRADPHRQDRSGTAQMTLALRYAVRSDVGLLREGNEDSAYAGPRLLAVADGMGGHAAGEVASAVAISALAAPRRRRARHRPARRAGSGGRRRQPARCTRWSSPTRRSRAWAPRSPRCCGQAPRVALVPHRRLARLPAARRRALPDHPRPHARADAGRRGPDQPRRGGHPPAAVAAPARARRPERGRTRPVGARGPARRPLPALLRRAVRRGQRGDAAPDAGHGRQTRTRP